MRLAAWVMIGAIGLLALAAVVPAQVPGSSDWPQRVERIEELLGEDKWKPALKQARKLADEIEANAWERTDLGRLLATIGRYHAVAEINLGMEREALWHWFAAWNLSPPTDLGALAALGHTGALIESSLRRLGEMPRGHVQPGDLELMRLEQAVIPEVERPILANDTASRGGRLPDLLVEVLIDRNGVLLHPVIDDSGVPSVAAWATLEWLLTHPPAQPATIDGAPVDTLQLLTIEFGRERRRGEIHWN